MKFLRYGPAGEERPGVLDDAGELRDLSGLIPDLSGRVLETLDALRDLDMSRLPRVPGTPRIGPPVAGTTKFVCIGLNYSDHATEIGMDPPPEPVIFLKANSSISGPNDPTVLPRGSVKTDWEVELAVIIGRRGKYISEADALSHVAGYTIVNDVSERDFQMNRAGQWTKGKSCDSFGPVGPWLVTPDEIDDLQDLDLWLTVNGQSKQSGSTRTMVFGVAHLISYVSQLMTLHPGDIVSTGTPPGVGMGRTPPQFLSAGDVVELGISGLGQQRQEVIAE